VAWSETIYGGVPVFLRRRWFFLSKDHRSYILFAKTIYNARCEEVCGIGVRRIRVHGECSVGAGVGKGAEKERMV
jgi:hypothetical protein